MNEEQWRVLRAIRSGDPIYIAWRVVNALRALGFVTFSWPKRGIVLTPLGKAALLAEDLSHSSKTATPSAEGSDTSQ